MPIDLTYACRYKSAYPGQRGIQKPKHAIIPALVATRGDPAASCLALGECFGVEVGVSTELVYSKLHGVWGRELTSALGCTGSFSLEHKILVTGFALPMTMLTTSKPAGGRPRFR